MVTTGRCPSHPPGQLGFRPKRAHNCPFVPPALALGGGLPFHTAAALGPLASPCLARLVSDELTTVDLMPVAAAISDADAPGCSLRAVRMACLLVPRGARRLWDRFLATGLRPSRRASRRSASSRSASWSWSGLTRASRSLRCLSISARIRFASAFISAPARIRTWDLRIRSQRSAMPVSPARTVRAARIGVCGLGAPPSYRPVPSRDGGFVCRSVCRRARVRGVAIYEAGGPGSGVPAKAGPT